MYRYRASTYNAFAFPPNQKPIDIISERLRSFAGGKTRTSEEIVSIGFSRAPPIRVTEIRSMRPQKW